MSEEIRTRRLVRDTFSLTASGGAAQILHSVRALLGALALGPSLYGVWQGLRFLLELARFSELGAFAGLRRELPIARGRGDEERQALLRGSALLAGAVGVAPILVGCVVAALFADELRPALLAVAVAAAAQQAFFYVQAVLQAEARMQRSSAAAFARALVAAALAWPLSAAFGITGFVGSAILGFGVGIAIAFVRGPRRSKSAVARELVRTGFPIGFTNSAYDLSRNADKLIVLALLGTTATGLYGLGDTVARFVVILPAAAAMAVAPHMLEQYARTHEKAHLLDDFSRVVAALSRVVPLLMGLAVFLCEPVIQLLLPRFAEAVPTAQVFCFAMPAAGISGLAMNVVVALGRQRRAAALALASGLLTVGLDFLVLGLGLGIEVVAVVAVASRLLYALVLTALAVAWLRIDATKQRRELSLSLLRFFWGGAAVLAVQLLRDLLPGGVWGRAAMVLLFTLPLLRASSSRLSASSRSS